MQQKIAAGLAFLAGAASLAIELVWMRQLSLAFGSASFAAGAVVAALMLGMALGSVAAGRMARRFARLNLWLGGSMIALAGGAVASSWLLPTLGFVPACLLMAAVSLPMGAIVPWLAAITAPTDSRAAGAIYACNTLGSALGVLAVGFLLLPAVGNSRTLQMAAGLLAFSGLAALFGKSSAIPESVDDARPRAPGAILIAYGVSAFAAMASEIGWIRAIILSIGSSTYAFTVVLGIYIAGLGLGAALSTRFLRRDPARTFGILQVAIALTCVGSLQFLGRLPGLFGKIFFERVTSLASFSLTALAAASVAFLLPTILIGGCFPVVARWMGARSAGAALGAATFASMAGSLVASFVAIPNLGIHRTLAVALMLHAMAGSVTLSASLRRSWPSFASAAILILLLLLPAWDVRIVQSGPYMYGSTDPKAYKVLFAKDDHVASVSVLQLAGGTRIMRIDGKTDASTSPVDLITQVLAAHVPMSVHGSARRVAIIGLGSGMTLGSCLKYGPQSVDCMEISPAVVSASRFFDEESGKPLDDPRVRLHVADARKVMRTLESGFDAIISEPSNLWIAGMAGLFTVEFYQTCASKLAEKGIICQWVHAYGISEPAFRDALATFRQVFPHMTVWEMWSSGDYLLIGSTAPLTIDAETMARAISSPEVAGDLRRIGVDSERMLLADLVAESRDLDPVLREARIQADDDLHIEFTAPLGFYGSHRLPGLFVLPPLDAENLARVVRGRNVEWTEGRTLVRQGLKARVEKRSRVEILRIFREAQSKSPYDRQARWFLDKQEEACLAGADREIRQGRLVEAWDELGEIGSESRWYADARLMMADVLVKQGAPVSRVIEEYRRVLARFPGHEAAASELAEILVKEGSLNEADDVTGAAVQFNRVSARLRLWRGRVLDELKRPDEARAEWKEAVRLDPRGAWGAEASRHLSR